jgi:hypothetical protein
MEKDYLILKRASASRPSGEWNDDDFDLLANGAVVGRIFKANAAPVGTPWMWTLAFGHHENRTPTHGTETIPIVAIGDDILGAGIVASLSRPGGNTTGLTILSPELSAKRARGTEGHNLRTVAGHCPLGPDDRRVAGDDDSEARLCR